METKKGGFVKKFLEFSCVVQLSFWFLTDTSAPERLSYCVYLLLFEMLREIVSLCWVFIGICCTTLSVDSVIINYLFWRCLFDPEISSANIFFVIKRTPHWFLTTQTPKIVTISFVKISLSIQWTYCISSTIRFTNHKLRENYFSFK